MFPFNAKCAGDVALCGALDMIARCQSRGREVHRVIDQARALKGI